MLVLVPAVLSPTQIGQCQEVLNRANWVDGKHSAGGEAASVKNNLELSRDDPALKTLSEMITAALMATPSFVANALPTRIVPPSFSRYGIGQSYGTHNDGAVIQFRVNGIPLSVRTDLAGTLFLSAPEDYDGGELAIEDTFGLKKVKLPAGDLVLYPASSQHRVEPITRGARHVAFFWLQSMVRDDTQRQILGSLDSAINQVRVATPGSPAIPKLGGVYHNLLRLWAET